jgi:hypothetical protein
MKLAGLLVLLCLAACGGKTNGLLPAPGTSACEPTTQGYCTRCSDDLWHCGGRDGGVPTCPTPSSTKDLCSPDAGTCTYCGVDGAEATAVMCSVLNPGGDNNAVSQLPVSCSQ